MSLLDLKVWLPVCCTVLTCILYTLYIQACFETCTQFTHPGSRVVFHVNIRQNMPPRVKIKEFLHWNDVDKQLGLAGKFAVLPLSSSPPFLPPPSSPSPNPLPPPPSPSVSNFCLIYLFPIPKAKKISPFSSYYILLHTYYFIQFTPNRN